jgi:hypothetical protein
LLIPRYKSTTESDLNEDQKSDDDEEEEENDE